MSEYKTEIASWVSEGLTKDQVGDKLQEAGVKYSQIPKLIKDAGVKFRRGKGTTWKDLAVEAFISNPELDEKGMLAAIGDSVKDPDYYVKGFYHALSKLAKGTS